MPSRARLTSATAAGVVGLAVAGLILFGTDPLGMGSTVIAVPPSPLAAAGAADETESPEAAAARPSGKPWRPQPTSTADRAPGPTYRPAPWRNGAYRPPATYGPRRSWWPIRRPTTTRPPTVRPTTVRPTTTRSAVPPTTAAPSVTPTTAAPTTAAPTTAAPTTTPTETPTADPSPTASSAAPTPSATSASPTATSTTESASPSSDSYAVRSDWASAVLTRLNAQRAVHGLPALTSNTKLAAAAHTHNVKMADADQLSHQLSGEPGLGARISAAGYAWSSVGENIAWNSRRSEAGVLALQDSMYNETPPNDGHRRNILSSGYTEVGIDVIEDSARGKVWLVTDFGRP